MSNFMDVVPTFARVKTANYGEVEITGLTVKTLAQLLQRHPELIAMLQGTATEFNLDKILEFGEEMAISFLAAGMGLDCTDTKVRDKVGLIGPADTLKIGEKIFTQSFPDGINDFLEMLNRAATSLDILSVEAPDVQEVEQKKAS